MSTYTKNLNDIYFLNDKNIVQDLHGVATPDVNAIPSLSLLQDSYRELSSYTDKLSTSISNTVSAITEDIKDKANKLELSVNGISAYVDKLELSVSEISTIAENKFVHRSGDDINYLNVLGQLSVKNVAEIDGNVRIHGSLVQGESVRATQKGGIALGISAEADKTNSFVWNGNDNIETYKANGEHGTFNINPENGVAGVYIGQTTLSNIIKNDTTIAYNKLSSQLYDVSVDLSNTVDIHRKEDKAELSNVLSTYTTSKITELCGTVDTRRVEDKTELTYELSTYINEICSAISSTIDSDKYSIASTLSIDYDKNTRNIFVQVKDRFGTVTTSTLSFDKVTSSQIVDRVEVLTPPTPGIDVPTIRIWWMPKPAEGEAQKSTDIPVKDLALVYRAGDGITITEDLCICVNDTIARAEKLDTVSTDVNFISSVTIPSILTNVANIQEYVDLLSVDRDTERGIICQLSDAIKTNTNNIAELSDEIKNISADISVDVIELSNDVKTIKNFDNMLCSMQDVAEGKKAVGVIPDIRHDISVLGMEIRTATNYGGTITICKYHPDWITSGYGNYLSSIFKWANIAVEDQLKNGNLYQVEFTPDTYSYDNITFAADQSYTTDDGYVLHHKDWLYVATGDSTTYVPLTALNKVNLHHIQSVQFDEYYHLSNTIRATYPWLAGNNTRDAIYEISVLTEGRVPVIISAQGHSFGENNDFEGNNRFYGKNYFLCTETDINSISCRGNISADGVISSKTAFVAAYGNVSVDINGISTLNNISAGVKIDVADNMIVDASKLAVNNISVDDYLSVRNMLSVGTKVDLLTSNIVIDNTGISSKYDISVDGDVYISSNLYVAQNLKVTRTETEITQPTLIKNKLSVESDTLLESSLTTYGNTQLCGTLDVKGASKFDNNVRIEKILSVDDVLSTNNDEKFLIVNNLKVNDRTIINTLTANEISAGSLSVLWNKAVHPLNGYTLADLSTDLSNKIYIKDIGAPTGSKYADGTTSDLSIIKIAKDEYEQMVATIDTDDHLCSNVLYIISADYIDAYGQVISNLAMTNYKEGGIDIVAEAVNKHYVDTISANLSSEILKLSTALSNDIKKLSADLSSEVQKLSTALSTDIKKLSADLSSEVQKLSTALSNDVDLLSADLSSEVQKLSTALSIAISNKIYIKDIGAPTGSKYADGTTSDLSIIKIAKDEYDEKVASTNSNNELCSNVLYIISADYIDAYGQVISNLAMTNYKEGGIDIVAEAVNKHYVDTISANLSSEVNKVRTVFKDLYTKIDTITLDSKISDIISAVVELKYAIANLTAY